MSRLKEKSSIKINKNLIEELCRVVPAHERSSFVESVLTRELKKRKLRKVLKKSYGAWKDENHPELATFEDVNLWVINAQPFATHAPPHSLSAPAL